MWLRREIWRKRIKAHVLFPFVTTVSLTANISSIQPKEENLTDKVWHLYRRMIWVDRKLGNDCELIQKLLTANQDHESTELANLLSLIRTPNFIIK